MIGVDTHSYKHKMSDASGSSSGGGGKRSGAGKLLDKLTGADAKAAGELGFECSGTRVNGGPSDLVAQQR